MADNWKELNALLAGNGMTISTAESLTGGMVAQRITSVPGSSAVFPGGIVSYALEAKEQLLDIPGDVLKEKGAVSAETACRMAAGARSLFRSDMALSTTGIAGPDGDGTATPVGTVFIGIARQEQITAREFHLTGSREEIREQTAELAAKMAVDMINQMQKKPG